MSHVEDLLHDWFLGALDAAESERVDAHLADCAACQEALDQHLALMADAAPTASPPPLEAILAEATSLSRFARFTDQVASLADVALDTARGWLSRIDDAAAWTETAMGELLLFHIDGGPAVQDAIIGFVQLSAGAPFPEHKHLGEEKMLVIQGGLVDENGVVHGPGSLVSNPEGMTHEIGAAPGVPLIYLNIVHTGLEIFGMQFGPDSPEF